MVFDLLDKREVSGDVISDEEIMLTNNTHARRVTAWVEVDGKRRQMTFLTNHLKWSAAIVCELYKARWQIEVFFKQIKQTLKLGDFLGHSANGVRWQVWTALLVYVLLRFISRVSQWTCLATCSNSVGQQVATFGISPDLNRPILPVFRKSYGTAGGSHGKKRPHRRPLVEKSKSRISMLQQFHWDFEAFCPLKIRYGMLMKLKHPFF